MARWRPSQLNSVVGRLEGMKVTASRLAALAGLVVVGMACTRQAEEPLPTPKNGALGFACYPVQFVRPPMGPPVRWCNLSDPSRADAAVVVMHVGRDGAILDASIPEEPSEEMTACLAEALGGWRLEPARGCTGEPLQSEYRLSYRDVFGWSTCLSEPTVLQMVSDAGGGRPSGCS